MAAQGSVIARVYTSDAYLPLRNVPVVFTRKLPSGGKTLLSIQYTDSSGLTQPLYIETPDIDQSLSPGASAKPFSTVDIRVDHPGFTGILAEDVQVFPNAQTVQGLQLRPLPITSAEFGSTKISGSFQNL